MKTLFVKFSLNISDVLSKVHTQFDLSQEWLVRLM